MSVLIQLKCSGCGETADGGHLRKEFKSFSGRPHGFGKAEVVVDLEVPEGWVPFDSYTYATYCPDCWKGIEEKSP